MPDELEEDFEEIADRVETALTNPSVIRIRNLIGMFLYRLMETSRTGKESDE